MWFCIHKYDKIQPDGYQYCKKCGKAIHPVYKCNHIWGTKCHIEVLKWDKIIGHEYILQCKKCGEIKRNK